jgi:hypothetical protein
MAEHYCPFCGQHHGGELPATEPEAEAVIASEITSADVRIAEINADKEIKLAKIAAGMIDAERDAELARAEGKADALEKVITPEPEPEPEPVVITDVAPEPEPEGEPTDLPPAEEGPEPHSRRKPIGLGMW